MLQTKDEIKVFIIQEIVAVPEVIIHGARHNLKVYLRSPIFALAM